MKGAPPPPYRIETERLVVRCYEPSDAPLLADAVESSREHLAPWLPWAADELDAEQRMTQVRGFRGKFDLGYDFVYGLFDREERQVLGGSGLHPRAGEGSREIGYWIRASALGQGLAREAAGALTQVGFAYLDLDRIDIRLVPDNRVSRRVPEALGFTHEATLARRLTLHGTRRDLEHWSMFRDAFAQSPCSRIELHAYDAAGTLLEPSA